jgi:hypothetical protein
MPVYFISGHCDITQDEFKKYYHRRIDMALEKKSMFVMGDARGVDMLAQAYLNGKTENVVVYHIGEKPLHNIGGYPTIGGFKNHKKKDSAMTYASDADIAWVRSDEEQRQLYGNKYRKRKSGTQKNLERRAKIDKVQNCSHQE